jgi:hypothetical protein
MLLFVAQTSGGPSAGSLLAITLLLSPIFLALAIPAAD